MPCWENQAVNNVFGPNPELSTLKILEENDPRTWWLPGEAAPQTEPSQQRKKMASSVGLGYGSLADYYDLTKAIDNFALEIPESPPSTSDDDSSSLSLDRGSSVSSSPPDLSPKPDFTLLTLDISDSDITATAPALNSRPWDQYLPKATPPHLRAYRLSSRRPKSTRPGRLQLPLKVESPKLLPMQDEPQLLRPRETPSISGGLNIFDNNIKVDDNSFLLPSPLSPCMPANFPSAPQNSPDEAYFPSSATSEPIPIPGACSQRKTTEETDSTPEMSEGVPVITKTCRRTPYYPPNASQTEDRSRVYMNRGPHYIANWTPLSSLPVEAQRRIERSMVKFTAPEGPEEK
ncbi:hypothetical protein V8F20_009708 [Naviculisporaceae sp. PSN 640]